jgi:hypothetical protein
MSTPSDVPSSTVSGASAKISVEVSKSSGSTDYLEWATSANGILTIVFWLVFSYGAAKLSYDKYRAMGWAILDFFFSTFYYPYYSLVLNSPTQAMIAAGRRR